MPAIPFRAALVLALVTQSAIPAAAATCEARAVSARGESSRFETLAKAKARGNWRAKVRATPALGAPYADWYKALASDYRCSEQGARHTCVAIAYPCRG